MRVEFRAKVLAATAVSAVLCSCQVKPQPNEPVVYSITSSMSGGLPFVGRLSVVGDCLVIERNHRAFTQDRPAIGDLRDLDVPVFETRIEVESDTKGLAFKSPDSPVVMRVGDLVQGRGGVMQGAGASALENVLSRVKPALQGKCGDRLIHVVELRPYP